MTGSWLRGDFHICGKKGMAADRTPPISELPRSKREAAKAVNKKYLKKRDRCKIWLTRDFFW
jgi:hypothetical protein